MRIVSIREAKAQLDGLLTEVECGEEIVIARASKPIARLVPLGNKMGIVPPERRDAFGIDATNWTVPDDFDDPLPLEIQNLFE